MSWLTDIWSGKRKREDEQRRLAELEDKIKQLEEKPVTGMFSTHSLTPKMTAQEFSRHAIPVVPEKYIGTNGQAVAMDDAGSLYDAKQAFQINSQRVPDALANWYANQGFIGWQMCAIAAQQWLIDKACKMPAEDASRNGWKFTLNSGEELTPEKEAEIRRADVRYKVPHNLVELTKFKRVFGFRIALFVVESDDPDYYLKPFNPDGIKPGSYRGISQVDPYWMTPELGDEAVKDPTGIHFYEPTWWRIGGKRYHRSHLVIVRHTEVADILKPSYLYGGISLVQQILERVYAAERTANEAPMLTMTKRMNIIKADLDKVFQNPQRFLERMAEQAAYRDNYGTRIINTEEDYTQHETSLADLDAVIMTQYQLVAAIAEVPATKLLGTSPKGFNATGEHETNSYHEMLAGIQTHDMTPLLERHYEIMLRSDFGIQDKVDIVWNPLDEPTEEQLANINKIKAETYATLQNTGGIDGQDVRDVLIKDMHSGFSGISPEAPEPEIDLGEFDTPPTDAE